MDILEVKKGVPVIWADRGGFQPCELHINGTGLIDLIRPLELPFAEHEFDLGLAAGKPEVDLGPRGSLAGSYLYLHESLVYLPSENLLGAPYDHGISQSSKGPRRTESILLGCTCGITECWFFLAHIEVSDDRVTWSDFRQFYRDWTYDLGPFVFDRAAYTAQLRV